MCDTSTNVRGVATTTPGHAFWVSATGGNSAPIADPNALESAGGLPYQRDALGHVCHGDSGWVYAADLKCGYRVATNRGDSATLRVALEDQETTVYNFAVSSTHTYLVLAAAAGNASTTSDQRVALWVHNHSKPSRLNAEILKSTSLQREVVRADNADPSRPGSKDHLHFRDGTVQNHDGTISHEGNGAPTPSNFIKKWLRKHGWIPYGG